MISTYQRVVLIIGSVISISNTSIHCYVKNKIPVTKAKSKDIRLSLFHLFDFSYILDNCVYVYRT